MERDDEQAAISPYEQRLEKCCWYEGLEAQCQTWWLFFAALWQKILVRLRLFWCNVKLSCRHVHPGKISMIYLARNQNVVIIKSHHEMASAFNFW